MVSIISEFQLLGVRPAKAAGAVESVFNRFIRRLEKVEKEAKVANLEAENRQRRPHSHDLHVQDFR